MQYPKPLSEKTLERMYRQAGISDSERDFLHQFFAVCENLYGVIEIGDMWEIYRELKKGEKVPSIRKKDLIEFSAIARREEQPYQIYELDELYPEEKRNELHRLLVSKDLIGFGYGKMRTFYEFMDNYDYQHPYFIPEDFLSYAEKRLTEEEKALLDFLGDLKVTAKECRPRFGSPYPCENRRKRLREFSFLNYIEQFMVKDAEKRPKLRAAILEEYGGTEAEKILRLFKRMETIGNSMNPTGNLQYILYELEEVGVELTEKQLKKLLKLVTEFHNNSRHWFLSGWKPAELTRQYARENGGIPPAISFGPGMQKAFEDGSMDKEELIRMLREKGIQVVE